MAQNPTELKKALLDAGLEVYRTLGDEVLLAERVRDNLIMDSGVRLHSGDVFEVRLVLRARRGQYPNEADANIFERVRTIADPVISAGFRERETGVSPLADPADSQRTLDTFLEVVFVKEADCVEVAIENVKQALALARTADPRR